MSTTAPTASPALASVSKTALWSGRILSGLLVLLLILDSVIKFMKPVQIIDGCARLGIPISLIVPIGVVLLICTILYAIPLTSVLGAILLTGYLGGAVMTNLRIGEPLFSNVLAPTYIGVLLWLALYLRHPRLRALLPLRT